MKNSIFDRLRDAMAVMDGSVDLASMLPIAGEWDVKVIRADGTIETKTLRNTVTVTGLNRIANRAVSGATTTPFYVMVVGTATAAPALTDSQSSIGEVIRRQFIAAGASAQSREWVFGVATFAGAADAITSVALDSAGLSDNTSSLTAALLANRVNGLGVTLGNSDFLNLTCRIRVGSHNTAHST